MKIAPNMLDRAECAHAVLTVDSEGREGLAGILTTDGWLPLVTLNPSLLPLIEEQAQMLIAAGIHVRIVRFTTREDLRDINPNPTTMKL